MRFALTAAVLTVVASVAIAPPTSEAQPLDGDIVISCIGSPNFNLGRVFYVDPNNPTTLTTLAPNALNGSFHNFVRMAPNNTDVVVSEVDSGFGFGNLTSFDPSGVATTISQTIVGGMDGFELDGDNNWICTNTSSYLYAIDHTTGTTKTIATDPAGAWNEVAILREKGTQYVLANFTSSTAAAPKLIGIDRQGVRTTLMNTAGNPLLRLSGIEVDPKTGTLITTDFEGPASATKEPNGVEVNRVTVGGMVTTLTSFGANGCKVNQDDTIWIGGFAPATPSNITGVLKFDLATSTVVTILQFPSLVSVFPISSVEVYGSRPLTCNGQGGPGQTIAVSVSSRSPFASSQFYQLACSFGRRPGIQFASNLQWLHLDVTDNLFLLTSQNLVPSIFRNFSGQLDPAGAAQAQVKLPANFPANLGLTVFCAGIIYDRVGNIVQVTNNHWFEL